MSQANVVNFWDAMLDRINARFEEAKLSPAPAEILPCEDCGEPGTYPPIGICTDCAEARREATAHQSLKNMIRNRDRVLLSSGVPQRQAKIAFQPPRAWPFDARRPDLPVNAWEGEPWSLLLTGPTGTGKTMLGAEVLFRFYYRSRSRVAGRFIRASRVPDLYFSTDASGIGFLEKAPVLLVDDLGRGHLGRAWEALGELVASRYDSRKPTILTSNLTLSAIAEQDSHLADRLSEGLVVSLLGKSRRELRA